jgi:hypothetical protein
MKLSGSIFPTSATLGAVLVLASCAQDPKLVASNCKGAKDCTKTAQPLRKIDKVDILLVVDDSVSMTDKRAALKMQLPRLLTAITTGADGDMSFPPAASVHVAVATTDMGAHQDHIMGCQGAGDDGVFITPGEAGVTCDLSYPGYLAYDGGPAAIATVDSVSCVPLRVVDNGVMGCGYEQPLEAGLKALWPASDSAMTFAFGDPHGDDEDAGFLRPDSLLVVVAVTDEDDCSTGDTSIFTPPEDLEPQSDLLQEGMNIRCTLNLDKLYDTKRYFDGFRMLRPHNDNVVFAAIAGVPPDLLSSDAAPDYDAVLADSRMQNVVNDQGTPDYPSDDNLQPSCKRSDDSSAVPPRRLVEVAKAFGENGALGSLCADDFGATTGSIIRTIGARLTAYGQPAP